MKNTIVIVLFAFVVLHLSACSTVTVRTDSSQSSDELPHTATLHRYLWGSIWNGMYLASDCESKSLQSVEIQSTFWEGAVSVLTLGIYCPIDVKYYCAKVPTVKPCPPCR